MSGSVEEFTSEYSLAFVSWFYLVRTWGLGVFDTLSFTHNKIRNFGHPYIYHCTLIIPSLPVQRLETLRYPDEILLLNTQRVGCSVVSWTQGFQKEKTEGLQLQNVRPWYTYEGHETGHTTCRTHWVVINDLRFNYSPWVTRSILVPFGSTLCGVRPELRGVLVPVSDPDIIDKTEKNTFRKWLFILVPRSGTVTVVLTHDQSSLRIHNSRHVPPLINTVFSQPRVVQTGF